ncbi:hypothetical protein [Pseudomonas aeruginosa]|nr:hypothetical protein [Pseudomonas aeruginosa]
MNNKENETREQLAEEMITRKKRLGALQAGQEPELQENAMDNTRSDDK